MPFFLPCSRSSCRFRMIYFSAWYAVDVKIVTHCWDAAHAIQLFQIAGLSIEFRFNQNRVDAYELSSAFHPFQLPFPFSILSNLKIFWIFIAFDVYVTESFDRIHHGIDHTLLPLQFRKPKMPSWFTTKSFLCRHL